MKFTHVWNTTRRTGFGKPLEVWVRPCRITKTWKERGRTYHFIRVENSVGDYRVPGNCLSLKSENNPKNCG